ncbi:phage tail assembly protein [Marinobacter sp. 1-3A]|uniref:phage tail assembly protein n=1 Tax=Marinobacter sp. 1-3A TaxID=2582920 RepID=UPI001906AB29|nr:phage tail assembly protein [Marinobacter sp. 1-3A]MBK1874596.1 phage tail assembly protein [Marinobacter sp. 1-3A]
MSKPETITVALDTPIAREGEKIDKVTLRKPMAGELRGLSLAEVINLDVDSITKLVPRISNPTLSEQEVRNMDPADLTEFGKEIAGFLLQKRHKG